MGLSVSSNKGKFCRWRRAIALASKYWNGSKETPFLSFKTTQYFCCARAGNSVQQKKIRRAGKINRRKNRSEERVIKKCRLPGKAYKLVYRNLGKPVAEAGTNYCIKNDQFPTFLA